MYRLVFLGSAVRDLQKIDPARQRIIKSKLLILAENPAALKNQIKRLGGAEESLFRLRVGSYRVVFKKEEHKLVILVIRIGHRKDVYHSLG
jgi:mRNA interferase RelE/StbE